MVGSRDRIVKNGDLIKIVTSASEIFGLVIDDKDASGWIMCIDYLGNIIWWPPEEMAVVLKSSLVLVEGNR